MKRSTTNSRISRLLALLLVALVAIAASGCGQEEKQLEAKEGGRIELDNLYYQVQLSRQLNPKDVEDSYYVLDQPTPAKGEVYFGVFMRVDNEENPTRVLPVGLDKMKIRNAGGAEYEPIEVKGAGWAYAPAPLGKGAVLPIPDTPAYVGPIRGGLILFRIPLADLDNRPLHLEIEGADGDVGEILIDV
ncbi:MAG: hypothetical protein ACPGWS_00430 [Solirubrobacterales bacterium]